MSDEITAKFPALRAKYPDEIEKIEADEKRIQDLLQKSNFYAQPEMQALLDICRRDVLKARIRLATDRTLIDDPDAQRELWAMIDARQWFIERASQNYRAELNALELELEAELKRER